MSVTLVSLHDQRGRTLGLNGASEVLFGKKSFKFTLERFPDHCILSVPDSDLVLTQVGQKVLVRAKKESCQQSKLRLFPDLKHRFAVQFLDSSNFLLSRSDGSCYVPEEPFSLCKQNKLFHVKENIFQELLDVRWPVRVSLLSSGRDGQASYLTNSNGTVSKDSPVKCCTEEFILEYPAVIFDDSWKWKGSLWDANGNSVLTRNDGDLSFTAASSCYGNEELEHSLRIQNKMKFSHVRNETAGCQGSESVIESSIFSLELSSKPVRIISTQGYLVLPSPIGSNQFPLSAVNALDASNMELSQLALSWRFHHHGGSVYSITDAWNGRHLFLTADGVLKFSTNPNDAYPSEKALFFICMALSNGSNTHWDVEDLAVQISGFSITCMTRHRGQRLKLCTMPDGNINLVESSRKSLLGEIFYFADQEVGSRNYYLQGKMLNDFFHCQAIKRSSSCRSFEHKSGYKKASSMRSTKSEHYLPMLANRGLQKIQLDNANMPCPWGAITMATAEMLAVKAFCRDISSKSDLKRISSDEEVDKILASVAGPFVPFFITKLLRSELKKRSTPSNKSKLSLREIKFDEAENFDLEGLTTLQSAIHLMDEEELSETFICKGCKGMGGVLKPLDPEINPQHHQYLNAMGRLQFGGTRRRRREGSPIAAFSTKAFFVWCLYAATKAILS